MDEPLSNLDAKLRVETRVNILKLHQRLETTFVYVTHDQVEAMTMGTRIAVMRDGEVQQVDTPHNLYHRPINMFVAGFMGSPAMNFLAVEAGGDGQGQLRGDNFVIQIPEEQLRAFGLTRGQRVMLGLRPEDLKDSRFPSRGGLPTVPAKVDVVEVMGREVFIYVTWGGKTIACQLDPRSEDIKPGQSIDIAIDTNHIHLFDPDTEKAL
jgi:multiple sugar transport system ATP-binding protein